MICQLRITLYSLYVAAYMHCTKDTNQLVLPDNTTAQQIIREYECTDDYRDASVERRRIDIQSKLVKLSRAKKIEEFSFSMDDNIFTVEQSDGEIFNININK